MSKENESSNLDDLLRSSMESVEKMANTNSEKQETDTSSTMPVNTKNEENTTPSIAEIEAIEEDFEYETDFESQREENEAMKNFITKKQKSPIKQEEKYDPFSHIDEPEVVQPVNKMRSSWLKDEEIEKNPELFEYGKINQGESFDDALNMDETDIGLQGTTDFTDYAAKDYNKKKISAILITLTSVLVVAVAVFVFLSTMGNSGKNTEIKEPVTNNQTEDGQAGGDKKPESPLIKYGSPEAAIKGAISVEVSENTLKTSENNALTISGAKIEAPYTQCVTNTADEFCLAGIIQIENTEIDTYFFNNISNSRIFETIPEFEKVEMTGFNDNVSKGGAATGFVKLGPIESKAIIVIFPNQSGYMLSLKEDVKQDSINKIISLSQAS